MFSFMTDPKVFIDFFWSKLEQILSSVFTKVLKMVGLCALLKTLQISNFTKYLNCYPVFCDLVQSEEFRTTFQILLQKVHAANLGGSTGVNFCSAESEEMKKISFFPEALSSSWRLCYFFQKMTTCYEFFKTTWYSHALLIQNSKSTKLKIAV